MGRTALGDDTARKLVYCVINDRLLQSYRASLVMPREARQFKLGWGFPQNWSTTAGSLKEAARLNAEEQDDEIEAERVRLQRTVQSLSAAPQPPLAPLSYDDAPGASPRRSPRIRARDEAGPADSSPGQRQRT